MGIGTDYAAIIAEKDKEIAERRQCMADIVRILGKGQRGMEHHEIVASIANLQEQLRASNEALSVAQASIDALMLEYCPGEMSEEQLQKWAAHQTRDNEYVAGLKAQMEQAEKDKAETLLALNRVKLYYGSSQGMGVLNTVIAKYEGKKS